MTKTAKNKSPNISTKYDSFQFHFSIIGLLLEESADLSLSANCFSQSSSSVYFGSRYVPLKQAWRFFCKSIIRSANSGPILSISLLGSACKSVGSRTMRRNRNSHPYISDDDLFLKASSCCIDSYWGRSSGNKRQTGSASSNNKANPSQHLRTCCCLSFSSLDPPRFRWKCCNTCLTVTVAGRT